jgi:hypothetical protein
VGKKRVKYHHPPTYTAMNIDTYSQGEEGILWSIFRTRFPTPRKEHGTFSIPSVHGHY